MLVLGPDDVVEREDRAARADPDALHDPGVVGADVQGGEERVVDPVLGVEVPDPVDEQVAGERGVPMQCAHPRPRGSGRR